jgi:hypothetical protein
MGDDGSTRDRSMFMMMEPYHVEHVRIGRSGLG